MSPGWLLLPPKAGDTTGYNTHTEMDNFRRGRPPEMREKEQHPASIAARDLFQRVQRALTDPTKSIRVSSARTAVARVVAELDELEAGPPADDRKI